MMTCCLKTLQSSQGNKCLGLNVPEESTREQKFGEKRYRELKLGNQPIWNKYPGEQTYGEQRSREQTSTEQTSREQMSWEQTSRAEAREQTPKEKVSFGNRFQGVNV